MSKTDLFQSYTRAVCDAIGTMRLDIGSKQQYPFSDLFFSLQIQDGHMAYQHYAEQMEAAEEFIPSVNEPMIDSVVDDVKADTDMDSSIDTLGDSIKSKIARTRKNLGYNTRELKEKLSARLIEERNNQHQTTSGKSQKELSQHSGPSRVFLASHKHDQMVNKDLNNVSDFSATGALNALQHEPHPETFPSTHLLPKGKERIPVLLLASAGHGKTTLLQRILLHYCQLDSSDISIQNANQRLEENYGLPHERLLACLIKLRNSDSTASNSIDDAIRNSIQSFLLSSSSNDVDQFDASQIDNLIERNKNSILLLVDGLDELADTSRISFLCELQDYLNMNPQTRVIVTSRIAGLTSFGIPEKLASIGFHGRAILPLSDTSARQYAEMWINFTHKDDPLQRERLIQALDQIFVSNRYGFLKPFTRTPLSLFIVLKQITSSGLSLNRYQMFHDMLWELLTNRENKLHNKAPLFHDLMALLSCIAYDMQIQGTLSISEKNLVRILSYLSKVTFQTTTFSLRTIEAYIDVLNVLTANIGILEKEVHTDDTLYSFPIRAYQEFLTAYACCHISFGSNNLPDPLSQILPHLSDSRWIEVVNFALADLNSNNKSRAAEQIISSVFSHSHDYVLLRSVIESDVLVSRQHAIELSTQCFTTEILNDQQVGLLHACLASRYGYAYMQAIRQLYIQASPSSSTEYLGAYTIATLFMCKSSGKDQLTHAKQLVKNPDEKQRRLGANMIRHIMASHVSEDGSEQWYITNSDSTSFIADPLLMQDLYSNALMYHDLCCAKALIDIWVCLGLHDMAIQPYIDEELAKLIVQQIENQVLSSIYLSSCHQNIKNGVVPPELATLIDNVIAIGTLPIPVCNKIRNMFSALSATFICELFDWNRHIAPYDRVALAVACFACSWNEIDFVDNWKHHVCKGQHAESLSLSQYTQRESNHFELVRYDVNDIINRNKSKSVSSNDSLDESTLFCEGRVIDAIQRSRKRIASASELEATIPKNNLAFLLRYGRKNYPDEVTDTDDIPSLLQAGIEKGDPYSLVNISLYMLECASYSEAVHYLREIDKEGWTAVTNNWWHKQLWKAMGGDPEGALVCLWARYYGSFSSPEITEMETIAKQAYGDDILDRTCH